MQNINEFRIFYNTTLHTKLKYLEGTRIQLLFLFALSLSVLVLSGWLVYWLKMPAISLLIWIPIAAYSSFLGWKMRKFKNSFKPAIVQEILDFIPHQITYDHKIFIQKNRFLDSKIFATTAPYYKGEDYLIGQVGSTTFEMCELDVRDRSRTDSKLRPVFRGIFFHATCKNPFQGEIIMLPRTDRAYLTRSVKAFIRAGGEALPVKYPGFNERFMTYKGKTTNPDVVINPSFYGILYEFAERLDKKVYISFVAGHIYIGIWEPKDILEPNILRSNVSFKLVSEFYVDLYNVVSLVEDFDRLH